jgi:hypothetical protein
LSPSPNSKLTNLLLKLQQLCTQKKLAYRLDPWPECPAALLLLLRRTPPPPLLALLPCPPALLWCRSLAAAAAARAASFSFMRLYSSRLRLRISLYSLSRYSWKAQEQQQELIAKRALAGVRHTPMFLS